jgi:hypothetical protein
MGVVDYSDVHQDSQHEVWNFVRENLFKRVGQGYSKDKTSESAVYPRQLCVDAQGLRWTSNEQLSIPNWQNLRFECLEAVHKHPFAGHFGAQRTLEKANLLYYWPNMARDIQSWVNQCDSCQRVKAVRKRLAEQLHPLEIPGRRWESISMDLITDLPATSLGYDSIWVCVDRLSKMVHLKAIHKTITAPELARVFRDELFRLHGVQFLGVHLYMSTRDHPQSDGQSENANGILEDTLRHFVGPYQRDWDQHLAVAEFAMNNAYHSGIRNTPFMLNYGQHPVDPVLATLQHKNPAVSKFIGNWEEQVSKAKTFYTVAQQRYKQYADKHRRPAPDYQPGDQVLFKTKFFQLSPGLSKKLSPRWVGPFTVKEVLLPHKLAVRLDLPSRAKLMHPVFHVSALRPYYRSGNYQPPPLPACIEGELEWEVDYIEKCKGSGKRLQYFVHWRGYPDSAAEWLPATNLGNAPDKVREFWEFKGQPCPHALCCLSYL